MKIRILLLLMAISFVGNTQGDLQFSQVISVDFYYPAEDCGFNCNNAWKVDEILVSIPAGKIWKITSASVGYSYSSSGNLDAPTNLDDLTISIDNVVIYHDYDNQTTREFDVSFPMWLGSGDYNFKMSYRATQANYNASATYAKVTGIEFNVVQ